MNDKPPTQYRMLPSEQAGYTPGLYVVQYRSDIGLWFEVGDPLPRAGALTRLRELRNESSRHRHDNDGKPYIAYFDREHVLGFVWDGDLDHQVQVQREMGEPIIDTFGIPLDVWDANTDLSTAPALGAFKACCQWYIDLVANESEDERDHRETLPGGIGENYDRKEHPHDYGYYEEN